MVLVMVVVRRAGEVGMARMVVVERIPLLSSLNMIAAANEQPFTVRIRLQVCAAVSRKLWVVRVGVMNPLVFLGIVRGVCTGCVFSLP